MTINSKEIIFNQIKKIKDSFDAITSIKSDLEEDFSFIDFFKSNDGQRLGDEIEWLSQFCISGFTLSSLNFVKMNEELIEWLKSDFFKIVDKQKKSLKDRWKWWELKRAFKTLIGILEETSDEGEEEDEEKGLTFEILSEQNTRYLSIFILSACTYTEVFAKNLLLKSMKMQNISKYLLKYFKLAKEGYDKVPQLNSPEFTNFQKKIILKCRNINSVVILDLIIKSLGKDKEIETVERELHLKSLRGMLLFIINLRNKLAHEDPLLDTENKYLESEMGEYIHKQLIEWEGQKSIIIKESPGMIRFIEVFDDLILDIVRILPFIQLLGFMLIAYPSLVERLVYHYFNNQKLKDI